MHIFLNNINIIIINKWLYSFDIYIILIFIRKYIVILRNKHSQYIIILLLKFILLWIFIINMKNRMYHNKKYAY